jgi:type III restriction enzyme
LFIPEAHREIVLGFVRGNVCSKNEIGLKATGNGMIAITNWHLLAEGDIAEDIEEVETLRYVKDDGLPAFYSPDFLVRTENAVYLVETKGQEQTIHPNVQRKLKAALAWCERINNLTEEQRGGPAWNYVLLAENVLYEWQSKGAHLAELLDYARLRPLGEASLQQRLI